MEDKFQSLLLFGNKSHLMNSEENILKQKNRLIRIFKSLNDTSKKEILESLEKGYLTKYLEKNATTKEKELLINKDLRTQYIYIDAILQIANRIEFNNFINN